MYRTFQAMYKVSSKEGFIYTYKNLKHFQCPKNKNPSWNKITICRACMKAAQKHYGGTGATKIVQCLVGESGHIHAQTPRHLR